MSGAELITGLYSAFAKGDMPTVLGMMDAEIRWHEAESNPYMPSGEAWVGPDSVLNNLFMQIGEDWEAFTVHPSSYHDAGNVVTVEGRYTGTHGGTGEALDAQFCHVWTLRDGKIVKFQQYVDTAALQTAMGTAHA